MPKKLTLPAPPVVPTQPTTGNLQDWAQKLVSWALDTRGKIESWSVNSGYLGIVTAEDTYAALAGNSSQTFSVADAATSHEAVSYEQVHGVQGASISTFVPSGTNTVLDYVYSTSFTAPVAGIVAIMVSYNMDTATAPSGGFQGELQVNGTNVAADSLGSPSWVLAAVASVAAGTTTVKAGGASGTSTLPSNLSLRGNWFYIPTP